MKFINTLTIRMQYWLSLVFLFFYAFAVLEFFEPETVIKGNKHYAQHENLGKTFSDCGLDQSISNTHLSISLPSSLTFQCRRTQLNTFPPSIPINKNVPIRAPPSFAFI